MSEKVIYCEFNPTKTPMTIGGENGKIISVKYKDEIKAGKKTGPGILVRVVSFKTKPNGIQSKRYNVPLVFPTKGQAYLAFAAVEALMSVDVKVSCLDYFRFFVERGVYLNDIELSQIIELNDPYRYVTKMSNVVLVNGGKLSHKVMMLKSRETFQKELVEDPYLPYQLAIRYGCPVDGMLSEDYWEAVVRYYSKINDSYVETENRHEQNEASTQGKEEVSSNRCSDCDNSCACPK